MLERGSGPLTQLVRTNVHGFCFWCRPAFANHQYWTECGQDGKFALVSFRTFRQALQQFQRGAQILGRFLIGRALGRLPPRTLQILDGLADIVAAAVMMRQFAQMIVQTPGKRRLYCLSGPLVQEFAALNKQRVIGDLVRQRVLEAVLIVIDGRLLIDEFAELQLCDDALGFLFGFAANLAHLRRENSRPITAAV